MNYRGVCKTAPATMGLLITAKKGNYDNVLQESRRSGGKCEWQAYEVSAANRVKSPADFKNLPSPPGRVKSTGHRVQTPRN